MVRSAAAPRWAPLSFGDLRIDSSGLAVHLGKRRVPLSPRERALLHYLVRRGSDTSSRREILSEVFGYDFDPGTNVIEVHIAHLRQKAGRREVPDRNGARRRLPAVRRGQR
jgi:DNA-binding response OmpR family regulator